MRVKLTEEMVDAACVAIIALRQTARWPDEFAPRDHIRVALTAALCTLPRGCDHVWGARTPPGNPHGPAAAYCMRCGEQPDGPIYAEPVFNPPLQQQGNLSHSFSVYDPGPVPPQNVSGLRAIAKAAREYVDAVNGEPEKDCWDTEDGKEAPRAEKFASDWAWQQYDDAKQKAFDNLCATIGALSEEQGAAT